MIGEAVWTSGFQVGEGKLPLRGIGEQLASPVSRWVLRGRARQDGQPKGGLNTGETLLGLPTTPLGTNHQSPSLACAPSYGGGFCDVNSWWCAVRFGWRGRAGWTTRACHAPSRCDRHIRQKLEAMAGCSGKENYAAGLKSEHCRSPVPVDCQYLRPPQVIVQVDAPVARVGWVVLRRSEPNWVHWQPLARGDGLSHRLPPSP